MPNDLSGRTIKPGLQDPRKFDLVGLGTGTITTYDVLQQVGIRGDKAVVVRATSANAGSSAGVLYMAKGTLGTSGDLKMSAFGQIKDVDTSGQTIGDPVYLSTAGAVSFTPGAVKRRVGTVSVVGAVGVGRIQFNGYADTEEFSSIPDPGDTGAISVRRSGVVNLVTAGAETRTLAAPSFAGQRIAMHMDTDGGNCVVTSAVAINAAGNTIMTFDTARDFIELMGVTVGGGLAYAVVSNAAVTLS